MAAAPQHRRPKLTATFLAAFTRQSFLPEALAWVKACTLQVANAILVCWACSWCRVGGLGELQAATKCGLRPGGRGYQSRDA